VISVERRYRRRFCNVAEKNKQDKRSRGEGEGGKEQKRDSNREILNRRDIGVGPTPALFK